MLLAFEDETPRGAQLVVASYGESEFKGHIEPWGWRRIPVKFNPRQIVKGKMTSTDQPNNAVETSLAPWNFQSCMRDEPKSAQPGDERQIQIFESLVVRYV